MGAPGWTLGIMRWLRDRLMGAVTMLEERARTMQTGREKFVQVGVVQHLDGCIITRVASRSHAHGTWHHHQKCIALNY